MNRESVVLEKVISGGQTGSDIAAVIVAKRCGFQTGGWMPKGFYTSDGRKPEWAKEFGFKEHISFKYVPRTFANVKDSDGTIRLAFNFLSAGEKCTMRAIREFDKPYIDVCLHTNQAEPMEVCQWIYKNKIKILNVAGNSEKTQPGVGKVVEEYFLELLPLVFWYRMFEDISG